MSGYCRVSNLWNYSPHLEDTDPQGGGGEVLFELVSIPGTAYVSRLEEVVECELATMHLGAVMAHAHPVGQRLRPRGRVDSRPVGSKLQQNLQHNSFKVTAKPRRVVARLARYRPGARWK